MRIAAAALAAAAAAAALAAGCSKEEPAATGPVSAGPPPAGMAGRPGPVRPGMDPSTVPGHPPVGGNPHAGGMPGGMPGAVPAAAGAGPAADHFKPPEGWQSETPSSNMRLLQYRLPRADGENQDAEVAVFTRIMGSAKENIDRWRGQFSEVVQGKDKVETLTEGVKGTVHFLDISGKFGGGMSPMAGAHGAGGAPTETRMIAAVVEHPSGPFYVKVSGPPATMGRWEESIRKFIIDAASR